MRPVRTDDRAALRHQARAASIARVYEKANRILSSFPVTCTFDSSYGAPAWSIEDRIFYNMSLVPDTYTVEGMISFTGVNYHELCHVMYTPRAAHPIVGWVRSYGMQAAFNILEDQRIESLMVAQFRATAAYFTSMFVRHCLDDSNPHVDVSKAHLLAYGRRYLPAKLRKAIRDAFIKQHGKETCRRAERIIDAYRKIVYRASDQPHDANSDMRKNLIEDFDSLLNSMGGNATPDDPYGHGSNDRDDDGGSYQQSVSSKQEEQQENASECQDDADSQGDDAYDQFDGDDAGDDADGEDGGQGESESDDDADSTDGQGDGASTGSKSSDGSETDDSDDGEDGDGQGRNESDSGTKGKGHGAAKGTTNGDDTVQDIAQDIDDAIQGSSEIQEDARDWQNTIKENVGKVLYGEQQSFLDRPVTPEYIGASKRFSKTLQRLWADADPGWRTHQSSGRLSMQRAMTGGDLDTVWDQWNEGITDANDIEMVLLVDCSTSMHKMMEQASMASWAIKRAVEQVRGHVTVLGYSGMHTIHYHRHVKAKPNMYRKFGELSSTNPYTALQQAKIMFDHSKARHKLLVIITDGSWFDAKNSENIIDNLNKDGVSTALGFLSDPEAWFPGADSDKHHCQVHASLQEPAGIVGLAAQMVKQAMVARR